MIEADVNCPFCGETFTILIDPSVDRQEYVEDCYVCCRPITVTATCFDGELEAIQTGRGGL